MYPGPAEIMCGAKLEPSPRVGDTAERQLLFGLFYSVPVLSIFPNHSYKPAMKQIQRHTRSCLTSAAAQRRKNSSLEYSLFVPSPLPLLTTACSHWFLHTPMFTLCSFYGAREVSLVHTFSSQPYLFGLAVAIMTFVSTSHRTRQMGVLRRLWCG
jgi:hypothetical protein